MALNTRELYLVLKARDEASRAVRSFGGNMSKVGQLQKKLNLEQEKSAQRLAAAKTRYAEAQVKAEQAKNLKLARLAAKDLELDDLKAESASKLTERLSVQAQKQTAVQRLVLERAAAIAEKQAIINEEMAKSAKERSAKVIRAARLEMADIRLAADAAIRANREEILSDKELTAQIKAGFAARIKTLLEEREAEVARADAAVVAAQKIVAARKSEIAATKEANAAAIAGARNAVREASGREHAAQRRLAVGSSVMTGGVTAAAVGATGLYALNKATEAYSKYRQTVVLTSTQVDNNNRKIKISLQQLSKIGIDTGKNMAVSFDQIQPMLYDIFSSIDTDAPGAAKLLRQIGRDAVGGSVDMETAGRTVLQIMNAQLKGTKSAAQASDVLFQLVRKGVGTYKEFGSYIGASIPSAKAAGQSLQGLAGMMAFLTRVGLKVPAASASAGRAIDAIVRPKAIQRLQDLGATAKAAISDTLGNKAVADLERAGVNFGKMSVKVADAHGNFRQMVDIASDMNDAFKGMNAEEKKLVLTEIFKGSGGTIQAMRFFNHAVNDSHGLLKQMTKDMYNAKGAAGDAYKAMSNTPEAKMQLLKNRFKALEIEIGQDLIPVKLKLVNVLAKIVGYFDKLSPRTRKMIGYFAAFVSIGLVVGGILAILAGMFITVTSAIELMGTTLVPLLGIFAAFIAVAATIAIVVKYHKQLEKIAVSAWHKFLYILQPVIEAVKELYPVFRRSFKAIVSAIGDAYKSVSGNGKKVDTFFHTLHDTIAWAMKVIVAIVKFAWPVVTSTLVGGIEALGPITKALMSVVGGLLGLFNSMPGPAKVATAAIIAFAIASRGALLSLASRSGAFSSVLTSFNNMTSGIIARAGGMKTVLASAFAGMTVGNIIGSHGGGRILGAFGGAASGAALGAAIGNAPGAAIGALVGGVTGLISAWGAQKQAAQRSAEVAAQAAAAEKQAVDDIYDSLVAVNGQYDKMFRQSQIQNIQKSGVLDKATNLGIDPKIITDMLTGAKGSYSQSDFLSMITKMQGKIGVDDRGFLKPTKKQKELQDLENAVLKLSDVYQKAEKSYEEYLRYQDKSLVKTKDLANANKNLKKYLYSGRRTIDPNTAAGTRNTAVIKNYIDYYKQLAQQSVYTGKSIDSSTKKYQSNLDNLRKTLRNAGFSARDVTEILRDLGALKLKPAVTVNQIKNAANKAKDYINGIKQGKLPDINADPTKVKGQVKNIQNMIDAIKQGHVPGVSANTKKGRDLIAQLNGLINTLKQTHEPKVNVDTSVATGKLNDLQAKIISVGNAAVNALFHGPSGKGKKGKDGKPRADGGFVFGPGTATSDDINARLSNGEFVVRAKQAKKYSSLLYAINAGRKLEHFAKGGRVGRKHKPKPIPYTPSLPSSGSPITEFNVVRISKKGKRSIDQQYRYGGHVYGTETAAKNARASASKNAKRLTKTVKDSIKNTQLPNLMYEITTASPTQIRNRVRALLKQVSKFSNSELNKYVGKSGKFLYSEAKWRDTLMGRLDKAKSHRDDLIQNRTQTASSIQSATTGTFDVTSAPPDAFDILNNAKTAASNAISYFKKIQLLRKRGMPGYLIEQLATAGPAAMQSVDALLSMTKSQFKQFVGAENSLQKTGKDAGKTISGQLYDAGIKAANGLVAGLQSKIANVERIMNKVAEAMVNTIKKKLGIKSPSRVFKKIGEQTMMGQANGMSDGFRHVQRVIDANNTQLTKNYTPYLGGTGPMVPNNLGGVGSYGKQVNFHEGAIQVNTQEINPVKHAADLANKLARRV